MERNRDIDDFVDDFLEHFIDLVAILCTYKITLYLVVIDYFAMVLHFDLTEMENVSFIADQCQIEVGEFIDRSDIVDNLYCFIKTRFIGEIIDHQNNIGLIQISLQHIG